MKQASKTALNKYSTTTPTPPKTIPSCATSRQIRRPQRHQIGENPQKGPPIIGTFIEVNHQNIVIMTCPSTVPRVRLENRQHSNRRTNHRKRPRLLSPQWRQVSPTEKITQIVVALQAKNRQSCDNQGGQFREMPLKPSPGAGQKFSPRKILTPAKPRSSSTTT